MDHKGVRRRRVKLETVTSLTLADLDLLREAENYAKEKPGCFRRMVENVLSGKWRIWRISGPCDLLLVMEKEDNWLNIHFAIGGNCWGHRLEIAAMLMPMAESLGLKGLRCYTTTPARIRLFQAFGTTSRHLGDGRYVLELSSEDFRNGRRW